MQSIISAGIPVPDLIIAAEDISRGKPDPEPYLKAAEILGVNPCECLVFEDAESGIQSATAAGMVVVAIGTNNNMLAHGLNACLNNYEGVDAYIEGDSIFIRWKTITR